MINGEDKPFYFSFTDESEYLFPPAQYCPTHTGRGDASSDAMCNMPGFEVALLADPSFNDWVVHPEEVNDELRWCRDALERY